MSAFLKAWKMALILARHEDKSQAVMRNGVLVARTADPKVNPKAVGK